MTTESNETEELIELRAPLTRPQIKRRAELHNPTRDALMERDRDSDGTFTLAKACAEWLEAERSIHVSAMLTRAEFEALSEEGQMFSIETPTGRALMRLLGSRSD